MLHRTDTTNATGQNVVSGAYSDSPHHRFTLTGFGFDAVVHGVKPIAAVARPTRRGAPPH